jgi:hypothetical protein
MKQADLIHDRASLFSEDFGMILEAAGNATMRGFSIFALGIFRRIGFYRATFGIRWQANQRCPCR